MTFPFQFMKTPNNCGVSFVTLLWRHNGHDSISNHRRLDCLLDHLFQRRSKETSKLCDTGLCEWNPLVTSGFPSQRASNMENISIWWRYHEFHACCDIHPLYFSSYVPYRVTWDFDIERVKCTVMWMLRSGFQGSLTKHWFGFTDSTYSTHWSWVTHIYMRQWNRPSLVQIKACRLLGAKPLFQPMLVYCQLEPKEQSSVKF